MKKFELKQIIKEIILQEGYSNYSGLTQLVRDEIDKNWNKIIEKKGNVRLSFKFKIEDKQIDVIVKFDSKTSESSHVKRINGDQRSYLIMINTKNILDFEKHKDDLISSLVHELTHIGQQFNNFHHFEFNKKYTEYVNLKKDINYNDYYGYYGIRHSDYDTEKEASLIELFEIIRRKNMNKATTYCIQRADYFNLYSFEKVEKKAISYGIEKNVFDSFLNSLKRRIEIRLDQSVDWDEYTKFSVIEQSYAIAKQFLIPVKDKIKKLFGTFKFDSQHLNYDVVKRKMNKIINDTNLK